MSNIYHVVAVKDELTGEFLQPTFGEDLKALERLFKTQVNTIPLWRENASDYSFYKIAEFNSNTGFFDNVNEKITSGHTVLERKENDILSIK